MEPPLRVLLLSLEFLSPFSGNGQYSRCIVRGLKRAGCHVLVVSGRPESTPLSSQDPEAQGHTQPPHGVIDIGLPKWGTLDRGSSWEEFAGGCCSPPHLARMAGFQPQVVVCVDYHTTHAWQGIKPLLQPLLLPTPLPPMVYMNFRLFCTSVGLHAVGGSDGAFYRGAERRAVREAALTIALCRQDALLLQALALGVDPLTGLLDEEEGSATTAASPVRMSTLLPPLRSDVATLVMQGQSTTTTTSGGGGGGVGGAPPTSFPSTSLHPGYSFLTSLVRLSPEKNAAAIPALLAALEEVSPGILPTLTRLQPFFAGAGDTSPYATAVKAALQPLHQQHNHHQPLTLCTTFMGPLELGHVLASSALNIHPCTADAYGMTIVEAAAWGVPSLVHVPPFPRRPQGGEDSKGDAANANAPLLPPPNSLFSTDDAIAQATERLKQSFHSPSTTATATATTSSTTGLFTPPPPTACSRVDLSSLLAPFSTTTITTAPSPPLGAQVVSLARLLPPVGACDLLAPSPHDPSTLPSIIPFDFTAPPVHQAKALIPILHAAVAVTRGEGGSVPPAAAAAAAEFARVKHSAKTCALAWSEEGHGETLRALLQGVVAANKAK